MYVCMYVRRTVAGVENQEYLGYYSSPSTIAVAKPVIGALVAGVVALGPPRQTGQMGSQSPQLGPIMG